MSHRIPVVVATLVAALVLPRAGSAQRPFEGVVTMRMGAAANSAMSATMWAKGAKSRIEVTGGPAAMTMITDSEGRVIMLVPSQKKYYVVASSVQAMAGANQKPIRIRKVGKSETIAGHRCEWYSLGRDGDQPADVCVARGLGALGADPSAGNPNAWSSPADRKALKAEFGDEFFPLRQKDASGAVIYEVTRLEPGTVAEDRFTVPPGWSELVTPGAAGRRR